MKPRSNINYLNSLYWLTGLAIMCAVMFLRPIDDDWFYLRYFPQHAQWGIDGYTWLGGNILLIRDYWRPFEDLLFFWETSNAPWLFPYLQHFLIVLLAYGAGWSVRCLGVKAGVSPRRMTWIMIAGMLVATNLGSLTSVDSLTNVSAAFWGLLSVRLFNSRLRGRLFLWVLTGFMSCLSKESGFVFILCGPLYRIILQSDSTALKVSVRRNMPSILLAIFLTGIYLGAYFGMKQIQKRNQTAPPVYEHIIEESPADQSDTGSQKWLNSSQSHALTPVTLVKNVAILYGLGVYPVAVSGFYYNDYAVIAVTLCLGWGGVIMLLRMWRKARRATRRKVLLLILLGLFVSLPSFVTRAGEISPFNSNLIFLIAVGVLSGGYRMNRLDWLFTSLFLLATLITDVYKYSIAYRGGVIGKQMADEIVAQTPPGARNILWVGVDEQSMDRAGAAYNKSPYRAFGSGSAAIHAMGYPADVTLTRYYVAPDNGESSSAGLNAYQRADSIARALLPDYDCVWLTAGSTTKVLIP